MRTRNLLALVLVLLAVSAGPVTASPVELYLVKFAPGTDVYRLAGARSWPLYHLSGQQALVGKKISGSDDSAILECSQIYRGPSENLRWVYIRKNNPLPAIKALYSGNDLLLADAASAAAAGIKSGGPYMVKPFNPQPRVISPSSMITNQSLVRDTAVAMLTNLVDTAQVRIRIEAMQSFDTRFLGAANHDSVVGWIRKQFLDMGIADVRTDTFDIGYGMQQHNIIATIPGLLDTSVVYIVGGHYDTYSPALYTQAPGADDNASGTVAALEMARVLSQPGNQPNCTVRFIAFDAEEYGLYGSAYYAQQALTQGMKIGCMLNYDMIGYKGNDSTFVSKLNPGSEGYAYLLGQMAGWYGRLADTSLVASYNNVYLSGSDSYEFSIRGFPVTYSEELIFSTVYHQINDSTPYMSMRYCTSIIKAGMGLLGTMANYPQIVKGLKVTDVGNGSQLFVQWQPSQASNTAGYRLYWGKASGDYSDTLPIADTSYTIGGLTADSLYYIGIIAIDDSSNESPVITEVTGTPRITPLSPTGLTAMPGIMSINLGWRSGELDLAGYRIYRKMDTGAWDSLNSSLVSDTVYTDSVPAETARYWYRIRAVDAGGNASPLSDSVSSYTYLPTGLSASPVANGIKLDWPRDTTKNINSFRLYRKINQSAFDSLAQITFPDTSYTDSVLSGSNKYYYRVRAFDGAGNPSRLSDSAYGRPITLDQGILVLDETNNWTSGSWPRDAQQDSFYNYIMSGYGITSYEYGTSLQKPLLADFGPYSTVAWFADDYAAMLASGSMNDLKSYIANGGKVWFAGWKPSGDVRNSPTYPADFSSGSILYDNFMITRAELSGTADSFKTAVGLKGYPSINVDTLKYPATFYGKTLPYIEALTASGAEDTIYVMDMKKDASPFEGRACAVRDSGKTVFFGFPLYFMDKEQVKAAAQKIMEEFGEEPLGIVGKPEDRGLIRETRLLQNAPNPFKQSTTINYQLTKPGLATLKVYNIQGQLVKTLVNVVQQSGSYTVKWDRHDNQNRQVSAGVYIYHLSTDGKTQSRKMIVLK